MFVTNVSADYNGIVLFEPTLLTKRYSPLLDGTNLFKKFTTTDEGDEILREGLIVPVLAIDSAGYSIVVRDTDEPTGFAGCELVVENAEYALNVESRLVIADLAVLVEWASDEGWQDVDGVSPGLYSVSVRGWRRKEKAEIVEAGYEFVLRRQAALPEVTADTGKIMQIFRHD
ncbi:hypothetical protein [Corallococcus llansteffanensis]|uniref:hypothetical protein n=1 Tax=Corallococcus llansteffanensis TaxID=2316731 RepID=UPI0011C3AE7C|nr:hypothetical protein [Corallococcus llansteffanensis]